MGKGKKGKRGRGQKKKKPFNPLMAMIKQTVADNAAKVDDDEGGYTYKSKRDTALNAQRIAREKLARKEAQDRATAMERARQREIKARADELEKQALEFYNAEQARLALEQEERERQERRRQETEFRAKLHARELRRRHREWTTINMAGQLRAVKLSRFHHRFDDIVQLVSKDREATLRRTRRRAKRARREAEAWARYQKELAEWDKARVAREMEGMALEERLARMEWWELDNYHTQRAEERKAAIERGEDPDYKPPLPPEPEPPQLGLDATQGMDSTWGSTVWGTRTALSRRPSQDSVVSRGWETRDVGSLWPRPKTAGPLSGVPQLKTVPPKPRAFHGLTPSHPSRRANIVASPIVRKSDVARSTSAESEVDDVERVRPMTASLVPEDDLDAAFGITDAVSRQEQKRETAQDGSPRKLVWDPNAFNKKGPDKLTLELQQRLKREQEMKQRRRRAMRKWEEQEEKQVRLPSLWEQHATRSNPG